MSNFTDGIKKIFEEGLQDEIEGKIKERLSEVQKILDDGEGIELHRAQGAKRELAAILELPESILEEAKEE